jgi:hypothetical protein
MTFKGWTVCIAHILYITATRTPYSGKHRQTQKCKQQLYHQLAVKMNILMHSSDWEVEHTVIDGKTSINLNTKIQACI